MARSKDVKVQVTGDYLPLKRTNGVYELEATPVKGGDVNAVEQVGGLMGSVTEVSTEEAKRKVITTPAVVSDEVRWKHEETCTPYRS